MRNRRGLLLLSAWSEDRRVNVCGVISNDETPGRRRELERKNDFSCLCFVYCGGR